MYPRAMSQPTVRDARESDLDDLAAMAHRAFRFGDGASWGPYFRENPHVRGGRSVMVHVDGRHAGNATAVDLTMSLRGRDQRIAGIAAVSTAPEYRRRGVGQAALRALLGAAREDRTPWAMLHAISLAFYRRVGFGLVELDTLLALRGAQLPPSALHRSVRPWDRAADEPAARAIYESLREGTTGQIARSDYWWTARVLRTGTEGVVVDEGGEVTGYALFMVPTEPEYPRQRLLITELRARTPHAWRALLGWAASVGDQYVEVQLLTAPSTALAMLHEHGLPDASRSWLTTADPFGVACAGAMARVVDLDAALAGCDPGGASGAVPLRVIDPLDGAPRDVDVIAEGGALRAEASSRGGERLALTVDRLSQVLLGAARARALLAMGFAEGPAPAARALDAMFAPTEVHLGQRNHF